MSARWTHPGGTRCLSGDRQHVPWQSVCPCSFLKVRHAVTGTLEQKDGTQHTVWLIPSQKIREFQKVFFDHNKISVSVCVMFLKKCPSVIEGSFYPLWPALLKTNKCLHWDAFDRTKASGAPYLTSQTPPVPFHFCKSFVPSLRHQCSTATLTLPHKSNTWITRLKLS